MLARLLLGSHGELLGRDRICSGLSVTRCDVDLSRQRVDGQPGSDDERCKSGLGDDRETRNGGKRRARRRRRGGNTTEIRQVFRRDAVSHMNMIQKRELHLMHSTETGWAARLQRIATRRITLQLYHAVSRLGTRLQAVRSLPPHVARVATEQHSYIVDTTSQADTSAIRIVIDRIPFGISRTKPIIRQQFPA